MSMYEIDLFISYAHIDNQPLAAGKSGWISRFHASLDTLLSMRLGKSVRIWRDDKLQGNDRFSDEIVQQFQQTAVLVSVLTPRYLNSEWCTKEVNEFCEHAENQAGIFVEHKARVFKVVKSPIETELPLPAVLQELIGYEFFTLEDGVPMELDDVYGEKYGQDFNRKVNKLAFEIADMLKSLAPSAAQSHSAGIDDQLPAPLPYNKPVVYLAECSFDLKDARELLETELQCRGYHVLPDRLLPREEVEYEAVVRSLLEQCALSIHLVGNHYGAVADGPGDKSVSVVQNEIAAELSSRSALKRLIWLEEGTAPEQENQQRFVDSVHNDAASQNGADLITGSLEGLKSAINAMLQQIEQKSVPEENSAMNTDESDVPLAYLVCTEQDRKATVPLRKMLREEGFSLSMPAFKGDAAEVREINQRALCSCDVIIVFYGAGEEAWKRSVDTQLKKLPAYLDSKPMPSVFTFLADPHTCDKDDMLDMEEPNLINGFDGLCREELSDVFSLARTKEPVQ